MQKLIVFVVKAVVAVLSVVGATTAPEDAAELLRQVANMIESGGNAVLWLLAAVLGAWAGFDVVKWMSDKEPERQSDEPISPENTITEHGVLTMGKTGYPERLTTWDDLKSGKLAPPPGGPPERSGDRDRDGQNEMGAVGPVIGNPDTGSDDEPSHTHHDHKPEHGDK